ncbi:MAG TPA: hypothetical protein VMM78_15090 [Thermomicrobiales bacterium]|nr:hypothetical protein [Thermomicrobiales bacterium]
MNAQERLRQAIDQQRDRLRAGVPRDREGAILAVLRARELLPLPGASRQQPDPVSGHRLADPGGNLALRLCVESTGGDTGQRGSALDGWAERFMMECGSLAEAELALAHCETGFMRLVDGSGGTFEAWITTKRAPATWRERAEFEWWAAWLAQRHGPGLTDVAGSEAGDDGLYRRWADARVAMMGHQLAYPPDALVDGCAIGAYRAVLGRLIVRALQARDRGELQAPLSERELVATLASSLGADAAVIGRAVAAFTLDRENAAWHAAVPGIAAAPLVRVDGDRLVWSLRGLTTEPLLFVARELRRRAAQEYNNTAILREGLFRQDLYTLFVDKRFVTSGGRIELRRDSGNVRTDIDAVVFDRKTGALAFFELKSQDPFARSTTELARQRDNLLYANRQISGALAWLQRSGANELLNRVDSRTAKPFRAHNVYPFVLSRYLAHFSDGPKPDRRAAWGTWPQLLRLLDGQPVRASDANPLASLFNRLSKDEPDLRPSDGTPPRELEIGGARLMVHPSYAAFQASAAR